MTVSFYTYSNPAHWEKYPLYEDIKDGIHICATGNMKKGIERYNNDGFQHIFTIQELTEILFPEWYYNQEKFVQFNSINKFINKKAEKKPENKELQTFKYNASLILESIRMMTNSCISPGLLQKIQENTKSLNELELEFLNLWTQLEGNGLFKEHRKKLQETTNVSNVFQRINENSEENSTLEERTDVILHGFYYITPEQNIIFKYLERAGFDLTFLNFYDKRFPETFDFQKSFINDRYGWGNHWKPMNTNVDSDNEETTLGEVFLSSYEEGKVIELKKDKPSIIKFESFHEFFENRIAKAYPLNKKEKNREKLPRFIASNANRLNEVLTQYYPERYKKERTLLNYPIGNFFVKIHEIVQKDNIILNEEILLVTFSSGWLVDENNGENARNYTTQLERILPYFKGCITFDDWKVRLKTLIEQNMDLYPIRENLFQKEREIRSIADPLSKISYFSVSIGDLEQIQKFFKILETISVTLFPRDTVTVNINSHFSKLLDLMGELSSAFNSELIKKEKKIIINQIKEKLMKVDSNEEIYVIDLSNALRLYLSDKLDSSSIDEDESIVIPFIQIDGEIFKKNEEKLYLTSLDEEGIPFSSFKNPWPLSDDTIEKICDYDTNFELFVLRNKTLAQQSRYLLYLVLKFIPEEKLELSWIANLFEKENLKPAIYMQQLRLPEKLASIDDSFTINRDFEERYRTLKLTGNQFSEDEIKLSFDAINNIEFKGVYLTSKADFYHNYLLKEHKVMKDTISIQFAISQIFKAMRSFNNLETEAVIDEIGKIVPQWSPAKRRAILMKSAYSVNSNSTSSISNMKVLDLWKYISFAGITKVQLTELIKDIEHYNNFFKEEEFKKMNGINLNTIGPLHSEKIENLLIHKNML